MYSVDDFMGLAERYGADATLVGMGDRGRSGCTNWSHGFTGLWLWGIDRTHGVLVVGRLRSGPSLLP